jgi:opacity protein-like surface antigen
MGKLLVVITTFFLATGVASAQGQAQGQPPPYGPPPGYGPPPPGYGPPRAYGGIHTHDGFFLQLDLGAGAMSTSTSYGGSTIDMSGTAGQFSLALGGAVAPNLILAGHLWGVSVSSPDVEIDGQSFGTADATLGLSGIGLNVTYYIMPVNIYLSVTPSIGVLTSESGGTTGETENGFALRLAAGKEWWVTDNWGLGLNLSFAHSSNKDKGPGAPSWSTNWFGLALSATYN